MNARNPGWRPAAKELFLREPLCPPWSIARPPASHRACSAIRSFSPAMTRNARRSSFPAPVFGS